MFAATDRQMLGAADCIKTSEVRSVFDNLISQGQERPWLILLAHRASAEKGTTVRVGFQL